MTSALLTIPQTAERLQVTDKTIRRMIERRQLRAVRVGGQIRIPEDALADFPPAVPSVDSHAADSHAA